MPGAPQEDAGAGWDTGVPSPTLLPSLRPVSLPREAAVTVLCGGPGLPDPPQCLRLPGWPSFDEHEALPLSLMSWEILNSIKLRDMKNNQSQGESR